MLLFLLLIKSSLGVTALLINQPWFLNVARGDNAEGRYTAEVLPSKCSSFYCCTWL